MEKFVQSIEAMNRMYKLPVHNTPTIPTDADIKLDRFMDVMMEEVCEGDEIIDALGAPPVETLTSIADWLGDMVVYCFSEAAKYGIPLESVLEIIMRSNMSKLGEDGKPIYDERGKVLKGPNFFKPEPEIREMLVHLLNAPAD